MLTTLCVIAALAAQTHPDFSGTWTVDAAKSDPLPPPPPARGRGPASVPANQIVIRQTADDVTMVRGPRNLTYHFDGTETFHFDAGEVRSTVAWDGNRLVVSWKKEVFLPTEGNYVTTTGKDMYSLSGNELTLESTTVSPKATTKSRTVFNK
jgi:hypothetical protein